MKIDFTKIMACPTLDSEQPVAIDVAKALGNAIYSKAQTFEMVDFARKIHDSVSEIELEDAEINVVLHYLDAFPIWLRTEIEKILKEK